MAIITPIGEINKNITEPNNLAIGGVVKKDDRGYLNQATGVQDKAVNAAAINQPTLDDYIAEAQKLGQASVKAQSDILQQDTEATGKALSQSLYGQNVGASGIGNQVIGKAITDQQKRLEPYAVQAGIDTAKTALNQRYEMTNKAIDMAVAGNLTGAGAQQIVTAAFGAGTQLTTNDQKDIQNAATAAGLTTEEYALMKRSIGTAQWDDIMANPQDYIDSPEKIRQFQKALAQMQVDATLKAAKLQADATSSAANSQAGATRDAANSSMWGDIAGAAGGLGAALLFSDKRLKKKKTKISNAIDMIKKIKPVRFLWNKTNEVDFGVIAQELAETNPELVHLDKESGYNKVNYNALFTILLASVQELIKKTEGK